ncbi:uncharacterized protein LOC118738311 [Rhagoletis pomonella]|uniref:uncharacterized protein LOC118738311 n=1 Tax=Rhagoletis pomonella TaxID=28610 RepID=UPI001783D196|nr:uncharacterized protein LOC118738311 [Rhagoletis pomonella]
MWTLPHPARRTTQTQPTPTTRINHTASKTVCPMITSNTTCPNTSGTSALSTTSTAASTSASGTVFSGPNGSSKTTPAVATSLANVTVGSSAAISAASNTSGNNATAANATAASRNISTAQQVSYLFEKIKELQHQLRDTQAQLNDSNNKRQALEERFISNESSTAQSTSSGASSRVHSGALQLPLDVTDNSIRSASANVHPFIMPPPVTFPADVNNFQAATITNAQVNQSLGMPINYAVPRTIQDLPEFSGLPEDWPLFYNTFTNSTAAYGYSNLENNQRLLKSLKGEAREIVKSLLIHPENVHAAMEQLKFRFGRPELLIRSQLRQVKDISLISESALVGKLPTSKKMEWARYAATVTPYPTVVDFSNWLSDVANLVCTVHDTEARRRVVLYANDNKDYERQNKGVGRNSYNKCPLCMGEHKISTCKRFLQYNVDERWEYVKRNRLCFSCLRSGHSSRECRSKASCMIDGCHRKHNKLLHESNKNASRPTSERYEQQKNTITGREEPTQNRNQANDALLSCAATPRNEYKLLFRVLPVVLYGSGRRVNTYAMLDEGSSVTMIDSSLIAELGVKDHQHMLSLQWYGGKTEQQPATVVNLQISGTGKSKRFNLRHVYPVPDLDLPMQSLSNHDLRGASEYLRKVPNTFSIVKPKLLIGLDHCHLGLPTETMQFVKNGPYAANTELGWVIFGSTNTNKTVRATCLHMNEVSDQYLHDMVKRYFEIENFGVRPAPVVRSGADVRAENILKSTTVRIDGRYQTGLLWHKDDIQLPDSFQMAEQRLRGIERKMSKNSDFAIAYKSTIQSYIAKNYAVKLNPLDFNKTGPRVWYLPHFAVENPNKPGKLRLVFDAAATVDGISLNSCLLKGPQGYQPMPTVLYNFRIGAIGVCGDIAEMYHQIKIQPEDKCAQRFLWRDDSRHQPDAPTKPMTIPRLELQAAVLGVRLSQLILEEHNLECTRILWSDSTTVISWLNSENRRYKPFVAHRIAKILAVTQPCDWKWVPTSANVADDATRHSRHIDLSETSRWFKGPEFLSLGVEDWPKHSTETTTAETTTETTTEELSPRPMLILFNSTIFNFNRFSSYNRLKRSTAWVLGFVNRSRRKNSPVEFYGLSASKVNAAEKLLCRVAQEATFPAEITALRVGQPLGSDSTINNLAPFIDDEKILRVGGRLEAATWLPFDCLHPIILPEKHQLTVLIVTHYHERMKHQYFETTIGEIRQKFWITRIRQVLRSVVASCMVCRASRAKP